MGPYQIKAGFHQPVRLTATVPRPPGPRRGSGAAGVEPRGTAHGHGDGAATAKLWFLLESVDAAGHVLYSDNRIYVNVNVNASAHDTAADL